jgi:uncharacterized protein YukE
MSQNNLPNNLPSVEKLIQRVAAAEKSQQREIRITIQEARDLTSELAAMTAKMAKTVAEIHTMLSEMRNSTDKIEIKFDGGGFGS